MNPVPNTAPAAWLSTESADVAILRLKIVPRAARTTVAGVCGDVLRIRVCAPPVDGKANAALIEFLAERLGVPPRCITIVSGASARAKRVRVRGVSETLVRRRLLGAGGPV